MQSLFNANLQEAAIENIWLFLKLLMNIEQNAFWKGGVSCLVVSRCPFKSSPLSYEVEEDSVEIVLIP